MEHYFLKLHKTSQHDANREQHRKIHKYFFPVLAHHASAASNHPPNTLKSHQILIPAHANLSNSRENGRRSHDYLTSYTLLCFTSTRVI